MANKCVPSSIAGVELHDDAKKRTHALLQKLEENGAPGVATPNLSMIDRFRLLASAFFTATGDSTPQASEPDATE